MKIEINVPAKTIAGLMETLIGSGDPVTRAWLADVIQVAPKAPALTSAKFYEDSFTFRVVEHDGTRKRTHNVNGADIARGLSVMASKYSHLFRHVMAGDFDQPCADIFMQCVCFGKEKYA